MFLLNTGKVHTQALEDLIVRQWQESLRADVEHAPCMWGTRLLLRVSAMAGQGPSALKWFHSYMLHALDAQRNTGLERCWKSWALCPTAKASHRSPAQEACPLGLRWALKCLQAAKLRHRDHEHDNMIQTTAP